MVSRPPSRLNSGGGGSTSIEFVNRNKKKRWLVALFKILNAPMQLSYTIRWRNRFFAFPYEWRLWAYLIKKTFGFI
jgi:hypothetical protein